MNVLVVLLILLLAGLTITVIFYKKNYHKVEEGTVLIINGMSEVSVHFEGGFVWPLVDKKMILATPLLSLVIERKGAQVVKFVDNIHADITVVFDLRVGKTTDDVLNVARTVSVAGASKLETLHELFYKRFSDAVLQSAKQFRYVSVLENSVKYNRYLLEIIGNELSGYTIEEVRVEHLEQKDKC